MTGLFCVDTDSVHVSGISNGGMFIYSKAVGELAGSLASIAPVAGAPLRQTLTSRNSQAETLSER